MERNIAFGSRDSANCWAKQFATILAFTHPTRRFVVCVIVAKSEGIERVYPVEYFCSKFCLEIDIFVLISGRRPCVTVSIWFPLGVGAIGEVGSGFSGSHEPAVALGENKYLFSFLLIFFP